MIRKRWERILFMNKMGQEQYPSSCCDGEDTGQSFQTCQPLLFHATFLILIKSILIYIMKIYITDLFFKIFYTWYIYRSYAWSQSLLINWLLPSILVCMNIYRRFLFHCSYNYYVFFFFSFFLFFKNGCFGFLC